MQFRQQRRRRVWPDEVTQLGSDADDPARAGSGDAATGQLRETYTSQARRDEQPRLTDLIPTRRRVMAAWYAGGAIIIGLLEGLHSKLDWLTEMVAPAVPRALDLAERGSFAAWCSSTWLSITALTSVLIYSLRRHRVDDYRGRYRIWIWAALAWMALAVNQTAQWGDLMQAIVLRAGSRVGLNQNWLWPVLCGSVAATCAARLTIEMRRSTLSLVLLWTGGLAWLAAVLCSSLAIGSLDPRTQTMLVAGLTLTGQWTILCAHMAYARHVVLDAHGLLAPRVTVKRPRLARRTRKAATAGESSPAGAVAESSPRASAANARRPTTAEPTAVDRQANHPAGAAAKATPGAKPVAPTKPAVPVKPAAEVRLGVHADDEDDDDSEDDSSDRGLSRTERKRLKRQQRGQVRNAA